MKVFVDTNVLVYARDASELEKQPLAARWLQALWPARRCCSRTTSSLATPSPPPPGPSPWRATSPAETRRWSRACAGLLPGATVITEEQIDFLAEVATEGIDIATRADISVAVSAGAPDEFRDPG